MDILEYIKQMQEMYGEDVITTADKLEKPPKTVVREMFQNAFKDNKADGGRAGYNDGQLVTPSVDGSRSGYQGPGKGNPGVPKQYKTKMDQLYTPEVRKKILDTRKTLFQETPVGKRLQWIANNGKNYDSPLEMKKAYEKHFNHKIGSKADALFYTVKDGVGVSVNLGVDNLEVLNKRLYLDQIDNLTNPGKQKRGVFSFTKNFSEDEIFKSSIIQNNPKVKKKFINLFADINKNAGTYAELGPEEMVLKLKSKGGYLLDGYEKGGFDFLKSYPRPGDPQQTIGGVHKGITRNTLINAGIPAEHIKSFQLVRKPLESIEEVLRKVSTNPNYAKKVWGVGSGTSQKIANQLNNFLEGQKEARKIVRDLDTMFIKGQMNKEGYKGTVDSYLKTDAGKASSYNFTKVFGGVQFDHTLAKSIGRDYKYLPRNYLLKGQFTTGKFNRIKKDIFDLPLIEMLKKHKEGKISGTKIKEFIDDFNKKTGGYAEFTFDEKKGKIAYPQEKKVIYDLSRYSNPGEVAKELEKNIKMTMSDEFQKGYKGIISKEDLKSFKTVEASNISKNLEDLAAQIDPDGCGRKAGATGGRIGLKFGGTTTCATKAKNYLNQVIDRGIQNESPKRVSLIKKILLGTGNFIKQNLSPKELLKVENLIGKPALYATAVVESGLLLDDVLRKKEPINVAAAENFLFGNLFNLDADAERAKNLLESGVQLSPAAQEYAQNILDYDRYRQNEMSFPASLISSKMPGSDKYLKMQEDLKNKIINTPDTGKMDYKSALDEFEGTFKAKPKTISVFGKDIPIDKPDKPDVTPLTNKLARPSGKRIGPMTAKKEMKIDFSLPTYLNSFPASNKFLNQYLESIGETPLQPGEGTLFRMNQPDQRGLYGTQEKFASGGLASLTDTIPPESGPMSEGLRFLYNNDMDY